LGLIPFRVDVEQERTFLFSVGGISWEQVFFSPTQSGTHSVEARMNSASSETPDYLLKIVIVGDSGVGKSNFMSRFTNDTFDEISKTTIGVAFATKNISIEMEKKKLVKLQVWDTAGQERYRALSSAYYRGAQGALVVYDITSRESLDSIPKWLEEIDKYCTQDIVVTLVGNKLDLSEHRCVSADEGKKVAAKENMFFIETSAKDATNIEKAFTHLIKEIIKSNASQVNDEKKTTKLPPENGISLKPPEEEESEASSNTNATPSSCSC